MLSAKPRSPIPVGSTPVYVGGYTEGFSGGTTSAISISLTSLTGGLASAPAENDIVIVCYAVCGSNPISPTMTGYTSIASVSSNDSFDAGLGTFYKKMTATPDTSISLNRTTDTSSGAVAIHVWRGQDLSSPFDATAVTASGINTGVVDPASIVVPRIGSIILCAGAAASGGSTNAMTASYLSNFITKFQNITGDCSVGVGSVVSTGGAYNPAAWTFSNDGTTNSWASVTMALKGA